MLSGLHDLIAAQRNGLRELAAARLRRRVLVQLHRALGSSGLTQAELAKRLGIRKSAVNQVLRGDGNVRINTLAEYLLELGYELEVQLVTEGEPRRNRLAEAHTRAVAMPTVRIDPLVNGGWSRSPVRIQAAGSVSS